MRTVGSKMANPTVRHVQRLLLSLLPVIGDRRGVSHDD
jgi:hypothetical protein